jgi:Bifunctional DNA primase/polymerase, N-terminal
MMWSSRRPFGPSALFERVRLRRAALRYAAHGWAVTPGASLHGHRFDCGRPGCPIMGCHPAIDSWEDDATADTARVTAWWRRRPYAVLLATGWTFDVVEVPASVGLRVLGAIRLHADVHAGSDARGPIAVTPSDRWMFLVRPGTPLRPELACQLDVIRHGRGSWIPAAPSRMPDGPIRWAVSPEQAGWRLPGSDVVQDMLVDALAGVARRSPRVAVPRQMSTSRRAA